MPKSMHQRGKGQRQDSSNRERQDGSGRQRQDRSSNQRGGDRS